MRLLLKGGNNETVSLPVLRAASLLEPLHGLPGGRDPDSGNQSRIPHRAVRPLRARGRRALLRSNRIEPDHGARLAERGWSTERLYPIGFQTRIASRRSNQEWLHPRAVTQQPVGRFSRAVRASRGSVAFFLYPFPARLIRGECFAVHVASENPDRSWRRSGLVV